MGKQSQWHYIMAGLAIRPAHIFRSYRVGLCKFKVVRRTGKGLVAKKAEVAKRKVYYLLFPQHFLVVPPLYSASGHCDVIDTISHEEVNSRNANKCIRRN